MKSGFENSDEEPIRDLEMVHWVEEEHSMRGRVKKNGVPVERIYETFQELYDAILENGVLVVTSPKVDVIFGTLSEKFEGHIQVLRQSGRNVRRLLIRSDLFERQYGTFQNCLDHVRSNNAMDCDLEISHLYEMAEELHVSATEFDPERDYGRLEVDIVAALQLLQVIDKFTENDDEYSFDFKLGYCVGRLFSSAQNLATLEPDACKANDYERSYRERGKKGKSLDRKQARLDHLFTCIEELVVQNPAFSRLKPIEVAKLASQDAASQNPNLWSQGRGQLDQYLTSFASEEKYKDRYRNLFPEAG